MGARAEFRVFGRDIIAGVQPLLWNGRTVLQQIRRMPPETYILSRQTNDANVKVRDGLLDIKVRSGDTPQGYEIFQPVGKYQFPVTGEQLRAITSALKIEWSAERTTWAFDEFCHQARQHPDLALVAVEKVRHGFTMDGVICEYAQVWFNGALVETACVESEDHVKMASVVEALGLTGVRNVNYLKAAKQVVGMATTA